LIFWEGRGLFGGGGTGVPPTTAVALTYGERQAKPANVL
jgi:hypothetical protein